MIACNAEDPERLNFESQDKKVPRFNTDSAYSFIEDQLSFGPRNPGSEGHQKTKVYMVEKLQSYAGSGNVFTQNFTIAGYNEKLELSNIIAAFNLDSSDRIMICAHWDTRPRAEEDASNPDSPILGADDGASGVGILLELARLFEDNPPPVGVDIILFDGEDYGKVGEQSKYFLGSRYWSLNPPVEGYSPRFGILLDMVGGKDALFPKEKYSNYYAPALVNEIWSIAAQLGYEELFVGQQGKAILDDHVVVNQEMGLPIIDIIRHHPDQEGHGFASYWHTHKDDLSVIDRKTLTAVGKVMAELIYNRIEPER
jgi:hypothetical protein